MNPSLGLGISLGADLHLKQLKINKIIKNYKIFFLIFKFFFKLIKKLISYN
jgi:hypothetical protein